jgi:hypothetical protein
LATNLSCFSQQTALATHSVDSGQPRRYMPTSRCVQATCSIRHDRASAAAPIIQFRTPATAQRHATAAIQIGGSRATFVISDHHAARLAIPSVSDPAESVLEDCQVQAMHGAHISHSSAQPSQFGRV